MESTKVHLDAKWKLQGNAFGNQEPISRDQ